LLEQDGLIKPVICAESQIAFGKSEYLFGKSAHRANLSQAVPCRRPGLEPGPITPGDRTGGTDCITAEPKTDAA
jgi:hypothetical protein